MELSSETSRSHSLGKWDVLVACEGVIEAAFWVLVSFVLWSLIVVGFVFILVGVLVIIGIAIVLIVILIVVLIVLIAVAVVILIAVVLFILTAFFIVAALVAFVCFVLLLYLFLTLIGSKSRKRLIPKLFFEMQKKTTCNWITGLFSLFISSLVLFMLIVTFIMYLVLNFVLSGLVESFKSDGILSICFFVSLNIIITVPFGCLFLYSLCFRTVIGPCYLERYRKCIFSFKKKLKDESQRCSSCKCRFDISVMVRGKVDCTTRFCDGRFPNRIADLDDFRSLRNKLFGIHLWKEILFMCFENNNINSRCGCNYWLINCGRSDHEVENSEHGGIGDSGCGFLFLDDDKGMICPVCMFHKSLFQYVFGFLQFPSFFVERFMGRRFFYDGMFCIWTFSTFPPLIISIVGYILLFVLDDFGHSFVIMILFSFSYFSAFILLENSQMVTYLLFSLFHLLLSPFIYVLEEYWKVETVRFDEEEDFDARALAIAKDETEAVKWYQKVIIYEKNAEMRKNKSEELKKATQQTNNGRIDEVRKKRQELEEENKRRKSEYLEKYVDWKEEYREKFKIPKEKGNSYVLDDLNYTENFVYDGVICEDSKVDRYIMDKTDTVAIKWKSYNLEEENKGYYGNELGILRNLRSKNIAEVYGRVFRRSENNKLMWGIVMEYLPLNLKKYYKSRNEKNHFFSPFEYVHIFGEMAKGIQFLHSMDHLHADIKCENFICSENPKKIQDLEIKVVDFDDSIINENGNHLTTTFHGTPNFYPPEVIKYYPSLEGADKNTYNEKSDIYCLGLAFYEIMFMQEPYSDLNAMQVKKKKLNNEFPEKLEDVSKEEGIFQEIKNLIKWMIELENEERPTINAVLLEIELIEDKIRK